MTAPRMLCAACQRNISGVTTLRESRTDQPTAPRRVRGRPERHRTRRSGHSGRHRGRAARDGAPPDRAPYAMLPRGESPVAAAPALRARALSFPASTSARSVANTTPRSRRGRCCCMRVAVSKRELTRRSPTRCARADTRPRGTRADHRPSPTGDPMRSTRGSAGGNSPRSMLPMRLSWRRWQAQLGPLLSFGGIMGARTSCAV